MLRQLAERGDVLLDTLLAALFGVEYGLFQLRDQARQPGIHVVAAQHFAQLLHAGIHRLVAAFGRQAAAHQAATQQVEAGIPAPFELLLLFEVIQVFLFPALVVVATHSGSSPRKASDEDERRASGRRISTATGRRSEIG